MDAPDNEIPTVDHGSNSGSSNGFDMSGSTMDDISRDGSATTEQLIRIVSKENEIPLTMETESTSNNIDDVPYIKGNQITILSTNNAAILSTNEDHTHSMNTGELSLSEHIDDLMVGVESKISRGQKTKMQRRSRKKLVPVIKVYRRQQTDFGNRR